MKLTSWKRIFAASITLAAIIGCGGSGDATQPDPHGATFTLSAKTLEISGPGEGRIGLTIADTAADPAVSATGGLTASIETTGTTTKRRVLVIDASAAGNGVVRLSNTGNIDSVIVKATAVTFKSIGIGFGFGCGIAKEDSRAWCWGANGTRQLAASTNEPCLGSTCQSGDGGTARFPLPVSGDRAFTGIAVSGKACTVNGTASACGAACATTALPSPTFGAPYCWGAVATGSGPVKFQNEGNGIQVRNLGVTLDLTTDASSMSGTVCGTAPDNAAACFTATQSVGLATSFGFDMLSPAVTHLCGVAAQDILCRGENVDGEIGIGATDFVQYTSMTKAVTSAKFTAVATGAKYTCALSTTSQVYCWGLGNPTPTVLSGSGTYTSFAVGNFNTAVCALTAAGAVDCWTSISGTPAAVQSPATFVAVSVGGLGTGAQASLASSCGLAAAGEIYCWTADMVAEKLF
jgi:hypothetical protein